MPTVGATPSSGTGTIVPPTSSVTPPGGSTGGIVKPGGGASVGGVKPLAVIVTSLKNTFEPATTLDENAALTQAQAQAVMGEIERRARNFAEEQLTKAYGGGGAAENRARNDMNALDGYLQAADYGQRDRIYVYTGLAVGLQTGEITLDEWKEELKELCGYRASASGGANGTCDRAIGRDAYLPVPCPTASDSRFQVGCNPAGPAKTVNSSITDRAQRNQFGRWLYGGFNLGQRPSFQRGGQLLEESVTKITARAEQAFYQVHQACIRARKATIKNSIDQSGGITNITINGPSITAGVAKIGGSVSSSIYSLSFDDRSQGLKSISSNGPDAKISPGLVIGIAASPISLTAGRSNSLDYPGDSIQFSVNASFFGGTLEFGEQGYTSGSFTIDPAGIGASGSVTYNAGEDIGCR